MAIAVMLVIILLNIVLLVIVMRLGTQGEHHSEMSAEPSTAVMTLQSRLSKSLPATVAESSVDTTDTEADDADSSADETDSE